MSAKITIAFLTLLMVTVPIRADESASRYVDVVKHALYHASLMSEDLSSASAAYRVYEQLLSSYPKTAQEFSKRLSTMMEFHCTVQLQALDDVISRRTGVKLSPGNTYLSRHFEDCTTAYAVERWEMLSGAIRMRYRNAKNGYVSK